MMTVGWGGGGGGWIEWVKRFIMNWADYWQSTMETIWNSSRSVCLGQTARLVPLLLQRFRCCGCQWERTIVGLKKLWCGVDEIYQK